MGISSAYLESYMWACDSHRYPMYSDYDYNTAPEEFPKIFVNIVLDTDSTSNNEIKKVDVNSKQFMYYPKLIIAWQDTRLRFCNHSRMLPLESMNKNWYKDFTKIVWKPQIFIENSHNQREIKTPKPSK